MRVAVTTIQGDIDGNVGDILLRPEEPPTRERELNAASSKLEGIARKSRTAEAYDALADAREVEADAYTELGEEREGVAWLKRKQAYVARNIARFIQTSMQSTPWKPKAKAKLIETVRRQYDDEYEKKVEANPHPRPEHP